MYIPLDIANALISPAMTFVTLTCVYATAAGGKTSGFWEELLLMINCGRSWNLFSILSIIILAKKYYKSSWLISQHMLFNSLSVTHIHLRDPICYPLLIWDDIIKCLYNKVYNFLSIFIDFNRCAMINKFIDFCFFYLVYFFIFFELLFNIIY